HDAEPVVQINVSGGFTRSELWVQTLADITGKPMAVMQTDDASAVGAAMLAIKKLNTGSDYPAVDTSDQKIFKPDMQKNAVYNQLFTIYKQAYIDLKNTMHNLSGIASG
ncbi:MAG: FGGY-family carbohydrate kinase, partial [Mucilaginibacter sp.]